MEKMCDCEFIKNNLQCPFHKNSILQIYDFDKVGKDRYDSKCKKFRNFRKTFYRNNKQYPNLEQIIQFQSQNNLLKKCECPLHNGQMINITEFSTQNKYKFCKQYYKDKIYTKSFISKSDKIKNRINEKLSKQTLNEVINSELYSESNKPIFSRWTEKWLKKSNLYNEILKNTNFLNPNSPISQRVRYIRLNLKNGKKCNNPDCENIVHTNKDYNTNILNDYCNYLCQIYHKHNLKKLYDISWLNEQYIIKERSAVDIADELGCSYNTVIKYLKINNFDIRQSSNYSLFEKQIAEFLNENQIKYLQNYGDIIKSDKNYKLELDFYLPDHNIAIEANGLYWHSFSKNDILDRNHLLYKTIACENKNIQLLHIFEDEWIEKKDIWKNIILSKCGIFKERIFARKCVLKETSKNEANMFLNMNHLQGYVGGNNFGLYYNNELIQIMVYKNSNFIKQTELIRFATKLNVQVIGGFGKLFKHIDQNMITYADRRYSNGNVYEKYGKLINISKPNVEWVDKTKIKRLSRYKTRHKNLPLLLNMNYNQNLTEKENMFNNGYRIIYDCGHLKYMLERAL